MLLHEVERGRRNDPRIILERGEERDVIDAHPDAAARIAVDMGVFGLSFGAACRRARLPSRGPFRAGARARRDTRQRSSAPQESPAAGSIGIHACLP